MENSLFDNKPNNKKLYYVLSVFLLLMICLGIYTTVRKNKLDASYNILEGAKVVSFSMTGRNQSGYALDYIFQIESKTYSGSAFEYHLVISDPQYLIGKYFPVKCNPKDPSNNQLLVTPDDFESIGYAYPDSLKWLLQYLHR